MGSSIRIRGARTHNLHNVTFDLPHRQITVVTGVSGSGKSSLVFDTLYAEGQRRYVQSLSTYARLFLERMDRPDADSISDIPPAIALRQKNSIRNARSTVGSVTEINDHLRLLYAAAGETFCPRCGQAVRRDTVESAATQVMAQSGVYLFLAPYEINSRPLSEVIGFLVQNGYHRIYFGGMIVETTEFPQAKSAETDRNPLLVIVDRVSVNGSDGGARVREALEKTFYLGSERARIVRLERDNGVLRDVSTFNFDKRFNCADCALAFPEPTPALFSSNSPIGACPECEGFGRIAELDLDKVIPNHGLSLRQNLIAPWRTPAYREMHDWMLACAHRRKIRTAAPYSEFTNEERAWLLDGEPEGQGKTGASRWVGVRGFFRWLENKRYKTHVRILLAKYRRFTTCPVCAGAKLRPEALNVRVAGKTMAAVSRMTVAETAFWLERAELKAATEKRASALVREIRNRVGFLVEVGLSYLTLERQGRTLSGGESQRIHLAGALGSLLTGTLYALDEPTVGLHARDTHRLLDVLRHLRDLGNTIVVVEHDPAVIAAADFLVELGPGGGRKGGRLIHAGSPDSAGGTSNGHTSGRVLLMRALAREKQILKRTRALRIIRAHAHNLDNIDVTMPLRRFVCITGVSGSGKSTLVDDVLYASYLKYCEKEAVEEPLCDRVEGLDTIGDMVRTSQELPTRSTRSNPATYLKVYDEIRKLFAAAPEARRLGIKPGSFSFNVAGGRCERCCGTGTVTIEMHFMADLEVTCDVCDGRRFQSHMLGIRLQNRNITEVLALTIDEARVFFAQHPKIVSRLNTLAAVGLGYLELGQSTATLSGGEAQRLKLARFLLADLEPMHLDKVGKRLERVFLLDEPTTGLSSSDIRVLMRALRKLLAEGNTLIVIEHNLELIAQADYIIDLGPDGGAGGGKVIATGGPLEIAASQISHTGRELRRLFGLPLDARPAGLRQALRSAIQVEG